MPSTKDTSLLDTVSTQYGPVRGAAYGGMRRWLGIPYASPPVDDLRWRPPIPPRVWKDPLPAVSFKGPCAQNVGCFRGFSHPSSTEDCLYLNVFSPAESEDHPLPVMVWIPGGGLVAGAAADYDPIHLVREGKVVLVSVDYRLNVFGFFSHPAINAEDHETGNYGFMDQQAALRWVQQNILAFGGDSQNVTIFGESAGGSSVATHLASPSSRGLFHRTIIQSAAMPFCNALPTVQEMEQQGVKLAAAAGCREQTDKNLRAISTADLLAADSVPSGAFGVSHFPFGLMGDGNIVPYDLPRLFSRGEFIHVPIIIGVTKDEITWFQAMTEVSTGKILTNDAYPATLDQLLQRYFIAKMLSFKVPTASLNDVLQRYPLEKYVHTRRAIAAVLSDAGPLFSCHQAATILQNFCEVFLYEFDVDDAPISWPRASFPYNSAHTQELQFLFHEFHGGTGVPHALNTAQEKLATHMIRYWTSFARAGSPASNRPEWPTYSNGSVMSLRAPMPTVMTDWHERHQLCFWNTFSVNNTSTKL